VDHAENDEHQDEGADELGGERLGPADGTVLSDTEADVAGLLTQNADDRRRAKDRTGRLRQDISGHLPPGELARHCEPERHRWVDVIATDVAQGVNRRDDDRAERQ
jgi:hypothetical protein